MKRRQLMSGERLEVGDVIVSEGFGTWKRTVVRVTKARAFVRLNDVAEGQYHRTIGVWDHPEPCPRPWTYSRVTHTAYTSRPAPEAA